MKKSTHIRIDDETKKHLQDMKGKTESFNAFLRKLKTDHKIKK